MLLNTFYEFFVSNKNLSSPSLKMIRQYISFTIIFNLLCSYFHLLVLSKRHSWLDLYILWLLIKSLNAWCRQLLEFGLWKNQMLSDHCYKVSKSRFINWNHLWTYCKFTFIQTYLTHFIKHYQKIFIISPRTMKNDTRLF